MKRRTALKALLAAPVLAAPTLASAQNEAALRCVLMEEREGAFILEGSGQRLTEPFEMQAGVYRIEVEVVASGAVFNVEFTRRSDGEYEDLFIVRDSSGLPEFSSGKIELSQTTEYVADVGPRGDWKIVLSPI